MKKIGIVAVTNYNYGSILQTFALQKCVQKFKVQTKILRYKESGALKVLRLKNHEYALKVVKKIFTRIFLLITFSRNRKSERQRNSAFKEFIDNNLLFSNTCHTYKELTIKAGEFDVVLLGSDQVWHPMNLIMDYFTLNFVPDNIIKAAYAPSFGVSSIPNVYVDAYKKYISRIQHVSCREQTGVRLIKELTGRNVPLVCDPTLLLTSSEWEQLMSDKISYNEKYVFCYFIGNNPQQRKRVREFANLHNCKVVALLHIDEYIPSDNDYADYSPYDVGPQEFLYLIKNANHVMTDSFHATVFSLLFHKEFHTFNRFENGRGNSTSSRIDSLLYKVGLIERKIVNSHQKQFFSEKSIDYHIVDNKLEKFRGESFDYLKDILK